MDEETYKVVYNARYGGYGLSDKAAVWLKDNARDEIRSAIRYMKTFGKSWEEIAYELSETMSRHDKDLVRCVEELGTDAGDAYSRLTIEEINSRIYRIDEYDGKETVVEFDLDDYVIIDN